MSCLSTFELKGKTIQKTKKSRTNFKSRVKFECGTVWEGEDGRIMQEPKRSNLTFSHVEITMLEHEL